VLMRSWLRRGTEPLEPKVQLAAVQSDAGGKSMAVRNPPCSSSNSNSSLEGKSAKLHKCMHAFLFFLSLSSSNCVFCCAVGSLAACDHVCCAIGFLRSRFTVALERRLTA
jgi:hypothetical protein